MFASIVTCRIRSTLLAACLGALLCVPAQAGDSHAKSGSVILRMCKSADKVKTLSVMCHSYLDGYLDAAQHFGKGGVAFCLAEGDHKRAPAAVVEWIEAHPESLSQPAAQVLQRALAAHFPCKGGSVRGARRD